MGAETESGSGAATATGSETGTGTGTGTETEGQGTATGTGTSTTSTTSTEGATKTGSETEGAGSKDAVLADLAKERKRRQELETELEERRKKDLSDQERAIEEARAEGRKEGAATALPGLFASEVRTIATAKLADPDVLGGPRAALDHLKLDEIPVTSSGAIDTEAITKAVDDLLERKPAWAKTANPGSGDNGPPAGGGGPDAPDLGDLSMEEYRKARGRT